MVKPTIRSGAIALVALLLAACGGPRLDFEVKARLDGQPVPDAQVVVDGRAQGVTDSQGVFAKTLHRRPGAEVEVLVVKELPGYRIEPWKTSFLVRLPKAGTVGKYSFDADLQATRFLTLAATASAEGASSPAFHQHWAIRRNRLTQPRSRLDTGRAGPLDPQAWGTSLHCVTLPLVRNI